MSLPEVQRDPQAQALPLVAMVGNPNTGKSSVFNALTGSAQRVANYPGVTVERVSGKLAVEGAKVELLDVPGLYSLEALSEDERVAVDVIRGASQTERRPDLLLCVMDAPGLERNLYLFTELADLDAPLLVAVTKTTNSKQKTSVSTWPGFRACSTSMSCRSWDFAEEASKN